MEKSARPRTALNECVKVVVRCRPMSEKERSEGYEEVPERPGQKWYERLSAPSKPAPNKTKSDLPLQVVQVWSARGAVQVRNPRGQDKVFTYDAAYDEKHDNKTIYDEMVRPLVSSVLDGFNGCVFAYGQTGTGKTHTMQGCAGDAGIVGRTFAHIWDHIERSASPDVTHLVSVSYIELYLEDVRDLLSKDNRKLTIKGKEMNGFYIPEMTSVVCRSSEDMERVMRAGNKLRAAGRTDMNEHSSRSHAVFLVTVESAHRPSNRIRVGKLNLVDLAGSERQRKTNASADRLREAARINQALSSLGNVISALAENSPHVPYRDSKLTRILQDSLGGNSKTIMIANIGPAAYNYEETVTTLRYAHRAKAIKNKPVRNEDPKDAKLREYQAEIERLRALIEQRRAADKKPKRINKPKTAPHDNSEEDTASLESEHQLAESVIVEEKSKTEELEARVRAMEERLVQGGGGRDLIDNLNQSRLALQQHTEEIAERKQREVEMQQRIEVEEETTAIVTSTFTTLQQEVDHKTQRLKKCLSKYAWLREEMVDLREAHDAERREREAAQASLSAELRRRLLVADSFVPGAGRQAVLRAVYDDDGDAWRPAPQHAGVEVLRARPLAGGGRRRPTCAAALAQGLPRQRAENLLDLQPLPLPPTTRDRLPTPLIRHTPPEVSSVKQDPPSVSGVSSRRPTARVRPPTAHHRPTPATPAPAPGVR